MGNILTKDEFVELVLVKIEWFIVRLVIKFNISGVNPPSVSIGAASIAVMTANIFIPADTDSFSASATYYPGASDVNALVVLWGIDDRDNSIANAEPTHFFHRPYLF